MLERGRPDHRHEPPPRAGGRPPRPAELAQGLHAEGAGAPGGPGRPPPARPGDPLVDRRGPRDRTRQSLAHRSSADEVADPYGGSLDRYRATAVELAELTAQLAVLLWPEAVLRHGRSTGEARPRSPAADRRSAGPPGCAGPAGRDANMAGGRRLPDQRAARRRQGVRPRRAVALLHPHRPSVDGCGSGGPRW